MSLLRSLLAATLGMTAVLVGVPAANAQDKAPV
jgi:hypothetical protein